MNKKATLTFLMSMLLFSVLLETHIVNKGKGQTTPIVYMTYPNATNSSVSEYYARLNDAFRVNMTVDSPDIGIWSWQVGIHFNNTILECTDLGNGTFFTGKNTLGFQPGTIHNDLGYVTISGNSLRLPETEGVKGTGVLMWFEFQVKWNKTSLYESSPLDLTLSPPDLTCGTKLNEKVDENVVPISPIILYDGKITIVRMGDLGGGLPPQFFNFDRLIDGLDLALFIECYKCLAPPEAKYLADLGGGLPPQFYNYDGKVDGLDLALFIECYKGRGPDTQTSKKPAREYFMFSEVAAIAEPLDPQNITIQVSQVGFKITAIGGNATNVLICPLQGNVPPEEYPHFDEITLGEPVEVGPITYPSKVVTEKEEGKGWPLLFRIICNEAEGEVTVYVTEFYPPP